jgi:hypothetical protein
VTKARHLFLLRATRIHLDEVEGLGSFVELETAINQQSEDEAHSELRAIADGLMIEASALIAVPYAVLLERRRTYSTEALPSNEHAPAQSSGEWHTASILCPSGSRTKAP